MDKGHFYRITFLDKVAGLDYIGGGNNKVRKDRIGT